MSVINLADRRHPVAYTVRITHHWDDRIEVLVEDVADDERSRQSVADALARAANTFGNRTAPIPEEIDQLTRERDEARAEVEKLRAENERLRADNERLRNEADLTREALGGWALVPPDGGADPTHERVAAVVAEVARMKKLHAPPADLPWLSREEGKP